MTRFYTDVAVAPEAGGWTLRLDDRPVRTPARAPLLLPTPALADAIADEWRAQGQKIEPPSMPLTGLANAAIDRIAPDAPAFAADLAAYGESDLLCYRALDPAVLAGLEAERWDPLLAWARARYDVAWEITAGIVHTPQPAATVARLAQVVGSFAPWRLAGLHPLVTIGGSLVVALAVAEGVVEPDSAFAITHLDEMWQAEHWGEDPLATATREARAREFVAGARFLRLAGV